ncbi:MAG: hypothetical protein A2X86_13280 [Bdellovibrionales bacterium GWA2_49_15]|nr:MAG: hypothetical protein A2X86_13280 [Bdellovibrionales bacterium GWA2_49_15]HAZ13497.1 hypothetical protein [Bdellovibrionales bacterium]
MKTLKHFFHLTIIGFCLSSIVIDLISTQEAQGAVPKYTFNAGRGPASVTVKKKVKAVPKKSSFKKLIVRKNAPVKESIKNWQDWNTFQINLTEVYAHNDNIFGTYKLISSNVAVARSEKHPKIFSQALSGQLGHMVIKRGKFYLFRPMPGHDATDNLTEVESIDFPIRMFKNGRDRFLSARLDQDDQNYFYKLKNYIPIFKLTGERGPSNQPTALLNENYESEVRFSCNKNRPNTYTCTASVTFTKRYTGMISINNPTPAPETLTRRNPAERI